jgi:outer membrane protein TolC
MKKTGNMTTSDRIRQQLILSGATVAIAEARMKNISAREMLTRKIGLSRDEANVMDLPQALPEAPNDPISIGDLAYEINNRLDVKAARLEYELLLKGLGLDELSSYTDIELGYRNDRINDAGSISNKKGYELEVKIPIFDWGDLQRDIVQSELVAKQQRYKNTVLAAASELRESYQGYRTAYDIAKHYKDQIIPMYETLLDEATYEYNGMIIGVFELVQVGLEKASAEIRAIDALQNLHLAELKLNSVLVGGQMGLETNAISDAPAKKAKGH